MKILRNEIGSPVLLIVNRSFLDTVTFNGNLLVPLPTYNGKGRLPKWVGGQSILILKPDVRDLQALLNSLRSNQIAIFHMTDCVIEVSDSVNLRTAYIKRITSNALRALLEVNF